eukprot:scaffold19869_cov33-Phaeocystis_antarctica.AAC.2
MASTGRHSPPLARAWPSRRFVTRPPTPWTFACRFATSVPHGGRVEPDRFGRFGAWRPCLS